MSYTKKGWWHSQLLILLLEKSPLPLGHFSPPACVHRIAPPFPQPLDAKPLLSQREAVPPGNIPQRPDRLPMSDAFPDNWTDGSHYDNTGFVSEEAAGENANNNPLLSSKARSVPAHGRRPLIRQERIVGVPLELEQSTHRHTPETEVPPSNPWQNWTRTPSPFEDRTAFPGKTQHTHISLPHIESLRETKVQFGELMCLIGVT